ncbi:aminoacyl-tRNA hydrolase [Patescibacteria group bacterium]|nr:aminoacyl-tRNA hydrolase [Patescibacteria group bacterium]MBU4600610.1 aminoacyl-tRNA hydrolase [Patescibacteria group bacterium]MCG2698358.1 aminoacyl-tRNA hydrolase [Candidatus Parcubacteria bacterium]
MRIIIGLGNPGEKYKLTRHNAGFMAVDALAEKYNSVWKFNKKFNADITSPQPSPSQGEGESGRLILAKPQTFMNNSGQAVQAILSYYKLLPSHCSAAVSRRGLRRFLFRRSPLRRDCDEAKKVNLSDILTVIHDDIDIELGKYKISTDSRSAGHNGVQSIINHLKTKKFKRIRIGIKTDLAEKMPTEKFVLQKFDAKEMEIINNLILEIIAESK